MMGDYHVRFCERLGVKFPLSTRPQNVMLRYNVESKNEKNEPPITGK
jgi:hypothetical protein